MSHKNYIRSESRNGSKSAFLGNSRFPVLWDRSPAKDPPQEGVIPRTFRPEGPRCATTQERPAAAVKQAASAAVRTSYCTRAGLLTAIPRSPTCRRERPESRGRTLRLRLRHSIDAAAPTANEDSSAASTAPVAENPYAIPITTPRTFPATIQPIIVSSARTRLSESATA